MSNAPKLKNFKTVGQFFFSKQMWKPTWRSSNKRCRKLTLIQIENSPNREKQLYTNFSQLGKVYIHEQTAIQPPVDSASTGWQIRSHTFTDVAKSVVNFKAVKNASINWKTI